ncbi:MAG: SGNH/GDSL hydrolase family protein [Gammaproteobacteria bacterium]|nr:SGNH/GDSL hydrolase family protein [Gammaproteobacteria bacterium]
MNYLSLNTTSPVVLILGDSHFARVDGWSDIWPLKPWQSRNLAVDGYQARQVYSLYRDQVLSDDHCIVLVMAGINRTDKDRSDDAAHEIDKLIRLAKKRKKRPVVLEVMYTENSNDTTYVKNLNEQLQSITEANNTKFIKVNHELSNAGKLLPQYSSDGLHLNNAGYSALFEEIRAQTLQFISTELEQCRG